LFDPEDVAGIIIEPIQGEGGYVPAPKFFLQELQRICRQHGIMFIVDEVQSGIGRTGKWWASEHAGIEPVILCSAKGIASGMPLGAMVAKESVMRWKPGSHGTTSAVLRHKHSMSMGLQPLRNGVGVSTCSRRMPTK